MVAEVTVFNKFCVTLVISSFYFRQKQAFLQGIWLFKKSITKQKAYRFHQSNFILGGKIGSTSKYNMNTEEI